MGYRSIDNIRKRNITDIERYAAGHNACCFDVDPISIARIPVANNGSDEFVSYDYLAEIAETTPVVIFKSKIMNYIDTHHSVTAVNNMILIKPFLPGHRSRLKEMKMVTPKI